MQSVKDVERGLAFVAPSKARNRVIARAHMGVKVGQSLLRLDHQAAPALEIEPEGYVVGDRVPATDIDIGAGLLVGEYQIEVVVLEVLCVGELHHFACCAGRRTGYE